MKFDIFNEKKIERLYRLQIEKEVDFEERIPWNLGVDISKPGLPLSQTLDFLNFSCPEEKLALSQLMGLIVASTISELETVANALKKPCFIDIFNKYPVNPEMMALGEQFFKEEQKHAAAFQRYIDIFAATVDIEPKMMKSFLPSAQNSHFIRGLYHLNAKAGGMALWWLVAAVEEESILIFRHLNAHKGICDPLYEEIHRCHFEEEVRHKSYACMMIELVNQISKKPNTLLLKRIDFLMAETLNISWTFKELLKTRKLKSLKTHHPFFFHISNVLEKMDAYRPLDLVNILFNESPYISSALHMSENSHIQALLTKHKSIRMPLPSYKQIVPVIEG